MDERFFRNQSVMVEVVPGLPEWEYWYAGDTHWHSDLTNSMNRDAFTIISSLAELLDSEVVELLREGAVFGEYGTPLSISSILAPALGLDWITITDHSYEIDGSNDDAGGPEPDAWRDLCDFSDTGLVFSTVYDYGWGNLEDSPAFDSFLFLKGEEVSIDANQALINAIKQYHMLVYDFDYENTLIAGPGYIDWERGLEMRDLGVADDGIVGDIMDDIINEELFAYAAHPTLSSWPFGQPWGDPGTDEISVVIQAMGFIDSDGQPLFRGFEFWNGRDDISGRDTSLDLWEDVLAYLMDPSDDSGQLYNWYLSGGSDEHMDSFMGGVLDQGEGYMGNVNTVVCAPSLSDPNVLDALYYGRSFVTDGPWFAMGIDRGGTIGSFMDFGIDTMMGEQLVAQSPDDGILLFDWPDQSNCIWGSFGYNEITLYHYGSDGTKRTETLTGNSFDAYNQWLNDVNTNSDSEYANGWQCYRAELTLGTYKAYTNPIWLNFDLNTPPTASNNTVTTAEDTDYVFTPGDFNFSDVDGDSLSKIQITALETAGSLKLSGVDVTLNQEISVGDISNLTFTPVADENGTGYDSFQFKVHDGTEYSVASYTMTIDVTPVNDPPTFTKGPDVTVNEDSGPYTQLNWATNISPGPANESSQTVSFNSNDNNSLFSVQPAISNVGTLTFTPATDAFGSATVTVIAEDDGGTANGGQNTSAAQSFTITVNPVIDPPVAQIDTISPNPAERPSEVSFNGSGKDIDGVVVEWEWTSDLDGLLSNTEDFTTSSNNLSLGTHQISFRVRDDDGLWSVPTIGDLTIFTTDTVAPTADLSHPADGTSILPSVINNSERYIDVTFADMGGSGLDLVTITDPGQEFTLGGTAASSVTLDGAPTPQGGTMYRYSFTGDFGLGFVNVNFITGSWADNAGNTNVAELETFLVLLPTLLYVDDDAPGDPVPGDPAVSDLLEDGSVDHPFDSIQEAVDAAVDGDTVIVADGTYNGSGNRDIERFSSAKKFNGYTGLVPSTYASGSIMVHGRLTKQGNKWLRWAFIEAVSPAIRKSDFLRRYLREDKVSPWLKGCKNSYCS